MRNKIISKVKKFDNTLNLQTTKKADNDGDLMDIARKEVITASPSTPIIEIANLMSQNDIRRIPITDSGSGKLLGIITNYILWQDMYQKALICSVIFLITHTILI